MPFRFYLLVSDAYPDGRFVLGRKTNRFISVGRCTYELNPRITFIKIQESQNLQKNNM